MNIDFDEASRAWRQNKKSIGQGSFKYVCGEWTKNGTPCQRPVGHRKYHSNRLFPNIVSE